MYWMWINILTIFICHAKILAWIEALFTFSEGFLNLKAIYLAGKTYQPHVFNKKRKD